MRHPPPPAYGCLGVAHPGDHADYRAGQYAFVLKTSSLDHPTALKSFTKPPNPASYVPKAIHEAAHGRWPFPRSELLLKCPAKYEAQLHLNKTNKLKTSWERLWSGLDLSHCNHRSALAAPLFSQSLPCPAQYLLTATCRLMQQPSPRTAHKLMGFADRRQQQRGIRRTVTNRECLLLVHRPWGRAGWLLFFLGAACLHLLPSFAQRRTRSGQF